LEKVEIRLNEPAEARRAAALAVLRKWCSLRPVLEGYLHAPEEVTFEWKDLGEKLRDLHTIGCWFYFPFTSWIPPKRHEVQRQADGKWIISSDKELIEAIHSASMYTFVNTVVSGLHPGPAPGKSGKVAVYAYRRVGAKKATSSSSYCTYSDLGGNGIFFGPRYRLLVHEYDSWRPGCTISAGLGQLALPRHMFHVIGVYVHAITRDDLEGKEALAQHLSLRVDSWHPEFEMPVSDEHSDTPIAPMGSVPRSASCGLDELSAT
jgi:hypothetical protein